LGFGWSEDADTADLNQTAEQAAKKMICFVILSEAKNPSVFVLLHFDRRGILRFAQNDSVFGFSARGSLFY
jgi:hypothetical protein